ncbi:uncharacterized protein LOC142008310 [Carettochelys insculpta]|uniref:uncharacterized protein LOC142008310 n=1 Tax=Carettochelys insculpta TaxID=44489 RepID=UPI003EB9A11D
MTRTQAQEPETSSDEQGTLVIDIPFGSSSQAPSIQATPNIFEGLSVPKTTTKIGTWNVRTLYQCEKLAQLLCEFDSYGMDILGTSEMRWTGSNRLVSDGKTILYSGNNSQYTHNVGLILSKEASRALVGWKPVNERIITVRFKSRHAKTTIIQVYAPTKDADEAEKDAFYNLLQDTISDFPNHDIKLLIGDMNAQIDNRRQGWEHVIGPYRLSTQTSDNGECLLLFCSMNNLCIGNTYFTHKNIHKKTWRSPDGITNNEIDYFCISKRWRPALLDVRVYRGADVGSDHHLLLALLRLHLKRKQERQTARPYAVEKLRDQAIAEQYKLKLRNRFQQMQRETSLEDQWMQFKRAVTEIAEGMIGRRRGTQKERWIQDRTWQLIDERKFAKRQRDQAKSPGEKAEAMVKYQLLDPRVKKSCRTDKKELAEHKGAEAQEAAKKCDTKTLYRIVQELTGAKSNSNASIKDKNGKILLSKVSASSYSGGCRAWWIKHCVKSKLDFTADNHSEQIFMLRNIIEQSIEFQRPLLINYIYFKKACCVRTDNGMTDFFNIDSGVRQGCILSPFLFLLVVDFIVRKAMNDAHLGILWKDQRRLTDLDFVDDIALLAETSECLQVTDLQNFHGLIYKQTANIFPKINIKLEEKPFGWTL